MVLRPVSYRRLYMLRHHGVIANMLIGAKLVLQEKFNARRALDLMESEGCTYSMGATPFIYDLVKVLKEDESLRLTTMKLYLCGGAPVPEYLVKDAYRYGIKVCEVYGSTESVPHIYVREEEVFEIMGSSSGRPMDGVEVRVVDENRKEVGLERKSQGVRMFVSVI